MKCWDVVREQIPRFQYEKLDILCELLKVEFEKVSRKPVTIDEFVVFMNDLKDLNDRVDGIAEKF